MGGWLAKATKSFGRVVPPEPQPFELTCVCRNEMRGMRTDEHQALRCARCGDYVFVLPRNPYPQPKSAPTPKKAPAAKSSPAVKSTRRGEQSKKSSRNPERSTEPSSTPVREADAKSQEATGGKVKGIAGSVVKRQRAIFTPFRLIVLALFAAIVGTGYGIWHERQLGQAETDVAAYAKSGEEAFRAHDYVTAEADLAKASHAVDVLKRDDPRATAIRQLARQSSVVMNLLPTPIIDVVERARDATNRGDLNWQSHFRSQFGDGWVVVHGTLEPIIDADGAQRLKISFPVRVEGKPVEIVVDARATSTYGDFSEAKEAVIASKLDSCVLGGAQSDRWIVTLNPDSLFLWTDYDALAEVGLAETNPPNEPLKQLLDNQAQQMGIER